MSRFSWLLPLALLAACGDPAPELFQPESCEELQSQIESMALRETSYAWSMGFELGVGFSSQEYSLNDSGVRAESAGDGGGASSYSTTNVQEVGVDEADRIKTDGEYLYTIAGGEVVVSLAWPVEEAQVLATVPVAGRASGLYLYGARLVVVSQWSWEQPSPRTAGSLPPGEHSVITVVDLSDPSLPRVEREVFVGGRIWDTRRVAGELLFVTYYDAGIETGDWRATLAEAKRLVRQSEVEDWLPWVHDGRRSEEGGWSGQTEALVGCSDLWMSKRETGTFFSVVGSLDLNDLSQDVRGQGVVGAADTLYATDDSLYIAYSETQDGLFASLDNELDTVVHRFDTTPDQRPTYTDSARLIGVVPDQFAFSEREGVLRVATSDPDALTTRVTTLATDEAGEFEVLDALTGLAPGEVLYSARFVGDVGYLVTYVARESGGPEIVTPDFSEFDPTNIAFGDPLFTVDLSDPRDIRVLGELELNGWSDYIHPLGSDHLITVGMDGTPGEGDWRVAVSVFDVSQLDSPMLVERTLLDARSSEAQSDHHAFGYFPEQDLLALPVETPSGSWALDVLHVDTEGVQVLGRVDNGAVAGGEDWCARMRRGVFLDDKLWAVSEAGMVAVSTDALNTELVALSFPVDACNWAYYDEYYYY